MPRLVEAGGQQYRIIQRSTQTDGFWKNASRGGKSSPRGKDGPEGC